MSAITKKIEIFKLGDIVVLTNRGGRFAGENAANPILGSVFECEGTITSMGWDQTNDSDSDAQMPVNVAWSNNYSNGYRLSDLEHLNTYLARNEVKSRMERTIKPYEPGTIVYIRPGALSTEGNNWPAIGTPYETDLKVIDAVCSKFASICRYNLFNPVTQTYLTAKHEQLVTPSEKMKYKCSQVYLSTQEVTGIIKKGEAFYKLGEYLYNDEESVILKVTPTILTIFTKIKL